MSGGTRSGQETCGSSDFYLFIRCVHLWRAFWASSTFEGGTWLSVLRVIRRSSGISQNTLVLLNTDSKFHNRGIGKINSDPFLNLLAFLFMTLSTVELAAINKLTQLFWQPPARDGDWRGARNNGNRSPQAKDSKSVWPSPYGFLSTAAVLFRFVDMSDCGYVGWCSSPAANDFRARCGHDPAADEQYEPRSLRPRRPRRRSRGTSRHPQHGAEPSGVQPVSTRRRRGIGWWPGRATGLGNGFKPLR